MRKSRKRAADKKYMKEYRDGKKGEGESVDYNEKNNNEDKDEDKKADEEGGGEDKQAGKRKKKD